MRAIISGSLVIAGISLVVGMISRLTLIPVGPTNIEAEAFLAFTNTCLLIAIAFSLLELLKLKS